MTLISKLFDFCNRIFYSIKWYVSVSASSFVALRRILDAEMKVHAAGVTNAKAEKEAVSDEEEERMWQQDVLGEATAKTLVHTIYFYNGKLFGMRSQEHR